MHKYNSVKISAFFCCEKTFSGFSVPHSKLNSPSEPRDSYASFPEHENKFSQDLYKKENEFCASLCEIYNNNDHRLHENQIKGFTEWLNRRASSQQNNTADKLNNNEILKTISANFARSGKYSVSATSLNKYYKCSLSWLFESVLQLENLQIETSLMAENISGLVYHAILHNFFTGLKDTVLPEPVLTDTGPVLPEKYLRLLQESSDNVFNSFPSFKPDGYAQMSALTGKLLCAGKNDFFFQIKKCLGQFLSFFSGCVIIGSECSYSFECEKYLMKGFVDCILKDNSEKMNKYIIIDFKLKHTPNRADCIAEDGKSLSDFQLPMYIMLAEEKENLKVYTALFFSIIDCRPEVIIGTVNDIIAEKILPENEGERIIRDSEQYKIIFGEFKNKTEKFVQEISTGNFTVFPQNNNDCNKCNYQRICRTVYNINRETIHSEMD